MPTTIETARLRAMLHHTRREALAEIAIAQALRKSRPFPLRAMQHSGAFALLERITVRHKRQALQRALAKAAELLELTRRLRIELLPASAR